MVSDLALSVFAAQIHTPPFITYGDKKGNLAR